MPSELLGKIAVPGADAPGRGKDNAADQCDALLQDGNGQRLSYGALRSRFDKAQEAAGVHFQFRDIRAKTATDTENLDHA